MKSKPPSGQIVQNYLGLAHGDYLAARNLLRNGFLEHGCMIAATAVEKYLKAVVGVAGISLDTHLHRTLYKMVLKCQPELHASLDFDFIKFLEKAFRLRYATVSAPGLAIMLNQYRTLMCLDKTIAHIDAGFTFEQQQNLMKTPYEHSLTMGASQLLDNNVAIRPAELSAFLSQSNKVVELKIEDNFFVLRAEYQTDGVSLLGSMTKIPELSTKKSQFQLTRG